MSYKYCSVPQCSSTTIKNPKKVFVKVPNDPKRRRHWMKLARRDITGLKLSSSNVYFCEDHFDIQNDMLNYMEFKIMGRVGNVKMKDNCTPYKFACQEDRSEGTSNNERPLFSKRQQANIVKECLKAKPAKEDKICIEGNADIIIGVPGCSKGSSEIQIGAPNDDLVYCKESCDATNQFFNEIIDEPRGLETDKLSLDTCVKQEIEIEETAISY